MAKEVFNRFEHKYLLNQKTYEEVLCQMDRHMELDAYNAGHKPYTIANIYYDTADDYLIRTSLSSPAYREKLRLRAYGVPKMDSTVFLEIKKKYNGLVNKRRTAICLEDAYRFIQSGKCPDCTEGINLQVLHELSYFLAHYTLFPKLYLAYDRIAYFEKGNPDLRISFDQNIRSRRTEVSLEKGDYGTPLMDENLYLMEVKTSLAKPLWLTHLLADIGVFRTSLSKYGTEFKQYQRAIS